MASKKKKKLQYETRIGVIPFMMVRNDLMVMLVTAKSTADTTWIVPKGKIEPDMTKAESAELEAFEEAGVHGHLYEEVLDSFTFSRRGRPVRVSLFPLRILQIVNPSDWVENKLRRRTLVTVHQAVQMVGYPGLAGVLHRNAEYLKHLAGKDQSI
ncbi:MAG: NUDIX domain-containing protein [candidate division KSB1 bacterium]|nr:NUDIX domain-containing protein [candidate division KSB1 bacterium]